MNGPWVMKAINTDSSVLSMHPWYRLAIAMTDIYQSRPAYD